MTTRIRSTMIPRTVGASGSAAALASVLLLALALLAAWSGLQPPDAAPASVPAAVFSAERALAHVRAYGRTMHAMGTPAHAATREYLLRTLADLGYAPEVQRATAIGHVGPALVQAGHVANVLARLNGAGGANAIMLMAHYDSVTTGPGASDDGAGVAALLEVARALKVGPPPANDVIFLFTDGEEAGHFGATAFAREHPWKDDVAVVLNVEASGTAGPSVMFETSSGNAWLIDALARAERPVAYSLTYEVYKRLPNGTDLTETKDAGLAGMNFSFFDRGLPYHTPLDDADHLDPRSLQHHGDLLLALVRALGAADLRQHTASGDDSVYFTALPGLLARYPQAWAQPLTLLAILATVGALLLGLRRGRLTLRGLGIGLAALPLALLLAGALVMAIWWLIRLAQAGYYGAFWGPSMGYAGHTHNSRSVFLAFVALTALAALPLYGRLWRRVGIADLACGALLWWLILAASVVVVAPGGHYLFMWPALAAALGWAALFAARPDPSPWRQLGALAPGAMLAILLLAPTIELLFQVMAITYPLLFVALVALLLGLLLPLLHVVAVRRWLLPALALAAALVCLAVTVASARFDADRPRMDSIFYALNADTGTAVWATLDEAPDAWTAQLLGRDPQTRPIHDYYPIFNGGLLAADAPAAALPAPSITVARDTAQGATRTVRLRLAAPPQAEFLILELAAPATPADLAGLTIDGRRVALDRAGAPRTGRPWILKFAAPPAEGVDVELELRTLAPVTLRAVAQLDGLPAGVGALAPRPAGFLRRPQLDGLGECSLVGRAFTLNAAARP